MEADSVQAEQGKQAEGTQGGLLEALDGLYCGMCCASWQRWVAFFSRHVFNQVLETTQRVAAYDK